MDQKDNDADMAPQQQQAQVHEDHSNNLENSENSRLETKEEELSSDTNDYTYRFATTADQNKQFKVPNFHVANFDQQPKWEIPDLTVIQPQLRLIANLGSFPQHVIIESKTVKWKCKIQLLQGCMFLFSIHANYLFFRFLDCVMLCFVCVLIVTPGAMGSGLTALYCRAHVLLAQTSGDLLSKVAQKAKDGKSGNPVQRKEIAAKVEELQKRKKNKKGTGPARNAIQRACSPYIAILKKLQEMLKKEQ